MGSEFLVTPKFGVLGGGTLFGQLLKHSPKRLVVHFLIYSHDSFFFLDLFVSLSGHILVNANVDYNGRFHLSRGCGEAHLLSVDNCNGQHWPVTVVDQIDRQMWWITLLDNCGPTFRNIGYGSHMKKNIARSRKAALRNLISFCHNLSFVTI